MASIRLHPEHGVNPSLDLCFWCGEAHGVALLGYNKNKEAPRSIVTSYEPCNKCQGDWAQGVALICVTNHPNTENQPPIQEGLYPTGQMVVITEDAVGRIFEADMYMALFDKRKGFIDKQAFDTLFGEILNKQEG